MSLCGGDAAGTVVDIFLTQKNAVRVISSDGYLDHFRPVFVGLRVLTVAWPVLVHSNLCHLKYSISEFPVRGEHHPWEHQDIDLPCCRLSKKKDFFQILMPSEFTTLCRYSKNNLSRKNARAGNRINFYLLFSNNAVVNYKPISILFWQYKVVF